MSKVIVDEIQTDTSNGNVRIIPNGTGVLEIKGAGGDDAMLQLKLFCTKSWCKAKIPCSQCWTVLYNDLARQPNCSR